MTTNEQRTGWGADPRGETVTTNAGIVARAGRPVKSCGNLVRAALAYAVLGFHVHPLVAGTKRPATAHGHLDATCDLAVIAAWWTRWPAANIGIALAPSDLVVIDLDRHHDGVDGLATLAELVAEHGPLPAGPVVTTAGGGRHYYYRRLPGMEPRRAYAVRPGADVLSLGYVVAPPSIVRSRSYTWITTPPDGDLGLPELPAWVVELAQRPERPTPERTAVLVASGLTGDSPRYVRAALAREALAVAHATPGTRNTALNCAAYNLASLAAGSVLAGRPCYTEAEAGAVLLTAAVANGLTDDRRSGGERGALRTIASGWRAGWANPRAVRQ